MTEPTSALVVVVPIGPNAVPAFVRDTLDSVLMYTAPGRRIILADDSGQGVGRAVAAGLAGVEVLDAHGPHGMGGGLYLVLSRAYAHALRGGHFEALLRLDTDALLIAPLAEAAPVRMLRADPHIAMGGEIYRDNCSVRAHLEDAAEPGASRARLRLALRRPYSVYRWRALQTERTLGRLYARAQANGYHSVDYVFGGCNVLSERFLRALHEQGLLPHPYLGRLPLQEDHLFGLLAAVVGMRLADMQGGTGPFGTAWKGLPEAPADLIAQGKTIVHSTRGWGNMDEAAVRADFRARRGAPPPSTRL